jgi:DNA-binding MarR family transcriptional regulator
MQRMWGLVHALDVTSRRMLHDLGVTGPQRLVIRVVGQKPDITPGEVARMLGLHPSTLTGVLARLARQRLIDRLPDREDRRRIHLRLTTAGRRVDRARRGTVEAAVRRALGRAEPATIKHTETMLELLVHELERELR